MKRDLPLLEEHLNQEVTVTLRLGDVLRLTEPAALPGALAATPVLSGRALPSIGSEVEDGIFAGVTLEDEHLAMLILLPGDESLKWEAAKKWAEEKGGVLPSRHDQLVLFRNVKSEFQDAWYWSGEQPADDSACAWRQYFSDGSQYDGHVGFTGRARAVRRIPIQ